MPSDKQPSKKPPKDVAQAANDVLKQLISRHPERDSAANIAAQTNQVRPAFEEAVRKKDPAAVDLGRRGGQKRAETLSAEERKRIAAEAARKRWGDKKV
ncbi:MAG TPA: hypothetical protein VFB22_04790 [Candidatus Baltobacteraceae bacterium]|nr:hypothetical protein [Candidatus Baltobacteraceae bacterium]